MAFTFLHFQTMRISFKTFKNVALVLLGFVDEVISNTIVEDTVDKGYAHTNAHLTSDSDFYSIYGDPEYSVPKLNPVYLDQVVIKQGRENFGLTINLRKCSLYGLENTKFLEARMTEKSKKSEWDFVVPVIELIGKYDMSGKILLLPVYGKGDFKMTLNDVKFTFKQSWVTEKRNGKEYARITEKSLDLLPSGATFKFENLFNGDKFLGENMNQFMNENWEELVKDLGPSFGKTFADITARFLQNIYDKVPYDIAFPK